MSTIGTNSEDLILNADGSGSDIKFKSNGSEVASISDGGVVTATSFAGSGANLTGVGVAGITSSADATAMTITSAERIGINKTSPDAKLEVVGANETTFHCESTVSGEYAFIAKSSSTNATPIADFRSGSTSHLKVLADGRGLSQFTAKFWCTWNQTGTQAISDSHNVSSIADVATGTTRVNFSNNMGSSLYVVNVTGRGGAFGFDSSRAAGNVVLGFRNAGDSDEDTVNAMCVGYGD